MGMIKKEKKNPSSRYARVEEPWLDEEETQGRTGYGPDAVSNGYGVSDSYSRQASYGHPDGYRAPSGYPEENYDVQDGYAQDDYLQDGFPQDGFPQDGYDAQDDYARDGYGGQDPYAQDGYGGQDPYAQDGYYAQGGYPEDGYYEEGTGPLEGDPRLQTGGRKGRKAKNGAGKSKKGFVIKLILLIIAAIVLILVWRFSRIKHVALNDIVTNAGITAPSGYKEFVIYGVDSREGDLTSDAHSDSIILCSMNESTKEARMVSVYRDTYLDNTNGEYRKATECYFYGGPSRSVNMLNKNLDLNLHDYITVDFNAVIKAVDLIGGVDVEVTEEELPYINGYQTENAEVTGAQITPVEAAGYQHLNGIQALAYCRIRYTEGWDFRRTERQRAVLSQIFEQAKSQGPVRMAQIIDTMLPYIATSFSSPELLSIATSISGSTLVDSVGFPFDQQAANISAGDCVVPVNLAQNVSQLHAYLYQESGYTPSQTVQAISDEIANTTGIY